MYRGPQEGELKLLTSFLVKRDVQLHVSDLTGLAAKEPMGTWQVNKVYMGDYK